MAGYILRFSNNGLKLSDMLLKYSVGATYKTRSTWRAQTSLANVDHDSHIAQCKNVEHWR